MIKPWRQCAHAAGRFIGSPYIHYIPLGPLREGGRIVEVRFGTTVSGVLEIEWMPFVCGTDALTHENCMAGSPVIAWSNQRRFGLPVAAFQQREYGSSFAVLPCSIRLVGGAKWVIVFAYAAGSPKLSVLCSVTVEGVDVKE